MSDSFELAAPDYFTTGAVGRPGQRVFYLQGREAGAVVTLKVEKEQIAALADYVAGLLAKLPDAGTVSGTLPLLEPVEPVWAVGSLGLGYDEAIDRLVVIANEAVAGEEDDSEEAPDEPAEQTIESAIERAIDDEDDDADEDDEDGATARFLITRAQAAAFVEQARSLVKAGRPICPMCSQPKDPGHVCPRSNGHVVKHE
ncbi:MAG: DUF3090 domain-containing protein [Candidatus Rokubacteria bacterium]|nr:DUF3090 domain-containing protein [Candidatus Rokubacteria bacterium]